MDSLIIIYKDGYEEHYKILKNVNLENGLRMQFFKQLIENDMIKLVIDNQQVQLIPLSQVHKIILQPTDLSAYNEINFTGFIHVVLDKNTF